MVNIARRSAVTREIPGISSKDGRFCSRSVEKLYRDDSSFADIGLGTDRARLSSN